MRKRGGLCQRCGNRETPPPAIRFSANGRSTRAQAAVSLQNRGPAGRQARLLLQDCRQPGGRYLLGTAAWDRGIGMGLLNMCPRVMATEPPEDMEKSDGHSIIPVTGRGEACHPEWKGVRGCGLSQAAQAARTGHQRLGSSFTTDFNLSPSWRVECLRSRYQHIQCQVRAYLLLFSGCDFTWQEA